jgi:hypothetical protein
MASASLSEHQAAPVHLGLNIQPIETHHDDSLTPVQNVTPSIHNELPSEPSIFDGPSRSTFRTVTILLALYVCLLASHANSLLQLTKIPVDSLHRRPGPNNRFHGHPNNNIFAPFRFRIYLDWRRLSDRQCCRRPHMDQTQRYLGS